ncbi:MAG: methionyl-tRNA formyltransferase, partial [Acidimicrobiia bacterium]|nr:methionyl-tRNA formyltransferase [Acidimicrobiia bacterium]
EGLDTGRVYRRVEVPIAPEATATTLRADLVDAAVPMLVSALRDGLGPPDPQQGEPVYAAKVTRDELSLDWASSAEALHRQIRVGGAWTKWRGKTLKIWSARPVGGSQPPGVLDGSLVGTGDGLLRLVEVQAEGKSRQPAEDWLRGARPTPGDRLGS